MNILITGASGYLGSMLARRFSSHHTVTAVVRSTSSVKRIENLPVTIAAADDLGDLEEIFSSSNPDIIINTVALYGRKGESISELVLANIAYPCQLLTLAKKYAAKTLIHTGTSLPDNVSPYALTKNTFVKIANSQSFGDLKFINIALEHFYGKGDDSSKFTSYLIENCSKNSPLNLTEGLQERDFVYIDDVTSAYEMIISKLELIKSGETISLGSGTAPTVRTLVETIHHCTKSTSELNFGTVPMRKDEVMFSCADTSRLNALGWQCQHNLQNGIMATLSKEKLRNH